MTYLVSYDLAQRFESSSVTDETLLEFAKELYKEGFIKANVEYDKCTDTNRIKYSITASKLSDECKAESNKQTEDNSSSDKNKRNFLKRLFKQ